MFIQEIITPTFVVTIALSLFPITTQANNKPVCSFINANQVNIRSGPGTNYKIVAVLNRGDGVKASHKKGQWVKLTARVFGIVPNERIESFDGWVSDRYINGCSEDQFDRWRSPNP